jgi:hypothetical protein
MEIFYHAGFTARPGTRRFKRGGRGYPRIPGRVGNFSRKEAEAMCYHQRENRSLEDEARKLREEEERKRRQKEEIGKAQKTRPVTEKVREFAKS